MYVIELFDMEEKALEPGFGGGRFESKTAMPVPTIGDTVVVMDRPWKVQKRRFDFHRMDNGETAVRAVLTCSPL